MSQIIDTATVLRKLIERSAQLVPEEEAAEFTCLHPTWSEGQTLKTGSRVQHNGMLYTVLQTHIAQATWTPDQAPSLFAEVLTSETGEILPWKQPNSTNPYAKGDKVSHNGFFWASLVDGNVWEPGVIGTEMLWAVVE